MREEIFGTTVVKETTGATMMVQIWMEMGLETLICPGTMLQLSVDESLHSRRHKHDGYVDYCDMFVLGDAYIHGTTPEDPRWNGHADLNNDRRIDYLDVFLFGVAYIGRGPL